MALPTVTVLNAAIDTIYSVFSNRKTRPGNRYAVGLLQKMRRVILGAYRGDVDFVVVDLADESLEAFMSPTIAADAEDYDIPIADGQDANLWDLFNLSEEKTFEDDLTYTNDADSNLRGAFITPGEILVGVGAPLLVGDIFQVTAAGDTVDDAFEAAKGSAPANGDFFMLTNVTVGEEEIVWLGLDISADGEFPELDNTDLISAVGATYRVQGTGDTVDNALQAAKGSAVADDDLFVVTGSSVIASSGANSIAYLGPDADLGIAEGALPAAFGRDVVVGDIFQVGGTGDTIGNDLESAKGSAVADGDVFEVTNVTLGSRAIKYLGAVASISTTDEEIVDFVALA